MAFLTTYADWLNNFQTNQASNINHRTHTLADYDGVEGDFSGLKNNYIFETYRMPVTEVKHVYGWLSLSKRDALFEKATIVPILIIENYQDLNNTYQDIFTEIFRIRKKNNLLSLVHYTGNNPPVTRPFDGIVFAP